MRDRKRNRNRRSDGDVPPFSWERVRRIFGNPRPPERIWERQFDYDDEALHRLAQTPYDEIDFSDLWYYHHDLAYVELQPDLFNYLFPVCLMDWHRSLMENQPCSHGDSEFHYGVLQGNIFEKMLTPEQRVEVYGFFRDSLISRLDAERGFIYSGSKTPAYSWMARFNSLGVVMPRIDIIWESWWLETPGRAVAALQYCSGLMYHEWEDNPLFGQWTSSGGGGGPYLMNDDILYDHRGWMEQNLDFLTETLTSEFVNEQVIIAASRLQDEPEWEKAQKLVNDLPKSRELVESRVKLLPILLSGSRPCDWSSW